MEHTSVCEGDYVKIWVHDDPTMESEGNVCEILQHKAPPTVRLLNGNIGCVREIIESESIIKARIMMESQHSENKENFSEDIMRQEVIPKTVQSFLNSDGGYLYIGVKDTGSCPEKRLVGLDYDLGMVEDSEDMPEDKRWDKLEMKIRDALERHLNSGANMGPLVRIRRVSVCGVYIAEIRVTTSPEPWFYSNISKNGKPKKYDICFQNKTETTRELDDFYIRDGGRKRQLETHSKFYEYARLHFLGYWQGRLQ